MWDFLVVFSFCKTKGDYDWKHNCCRLFVRNLASGLLQIGQKIGKMTMTSQFSDMTSTSNFFEVILFLLSSLVTGRSFMSISLRLLELWQEIRKSEIPTSEFCPISGNSGELWIPNLARMSLIECCWTLQSPGFTAFTVLELLRENQLGEGGVKLPPLPTQIKVKLGTVLT